MANNKYLKGMNRENTKQSKGNDTSALRKQ